MSHMFFAFIIGFLALADDESASDDVPSEQLALYSGGGKCVPMEITTPKGLRITDYICMKDGIQVGRAYESLAECEKFCSTGSN